MYNESQAAKKAMIKVVSKFASQEISSITSNNTQKRLKSLEGNVTMDRMGDFSWRIVMEESLELMPITTSFLDCLMPQQSDMRKGVMKGKR